MENFWRGLFALIGIALIVVLAFYVSNRFGDSITDVVAPPTTPQLVQPLPGYQQPAMYAGTGQVQIPETCNKVSGKNCAPVTVDGCNGCCTGGRFWDPVKERCSCLEGYHFKGGTCVPWKWEPTVSTKAVVAAAHTKYVCPNGDNVVDPKQCPLPGLIVTHTCADGRSVYGTVPYGQSYEVLCKK